MQSPISRENKTSRDKENIINPTIEKEQKVKDKHGKEEIERICQKKFHISVIVINISGQNSSTKSLSLSR